jgi:hypothetical protein
MMESKIGELAGKVWFYLKDHGEVSYAVLRRDVVTTECPMPDVMLSSAIGWLAREEKVKLHESGTGRGYRIRVALVN